MKLNLAKNLAPLREAALAQLASIIAARRAELLTPDMSDVYKLKTDEAERISIDPEIDPRLVPYCAAEADLFGLTLLEQAQIVLTRAHHCADAGLSLEVARQRAKSMIVEAKTPADINAALNAL